MFYAGKHGVESYLDPDFGKEFKWDVPLLEGYEYEFVKSRRMPLINGPVADNFPTGMARRFFAGNYDAVMVNGYASGAAWAGMLGAWRTGTPLIMRGTHT